MPHIRLRDKIVGNLQKASALWPIVGLVGPRQCGKSTMLRELLGQRNMVSLDDSDHLESALDSPKVFLNSFEYPLVIDEVQKAPKLFDALKLHVDQKKIPGTFFITGSMQFSQKIGIRESLTGRIGIERLFPLTLREAHSVKDFGLNRIKPMHSLASHFTVQEFSSALFKGGMPFPMFLHSEEERRRYWESWLETSVFRDLSRVFGRSFDPDLSMRILNKMGKILAEGELPTLNQFPQDARVLRKYFYAMEEIFLLNRISPHEKAIGQDAWLPFDAGLADYLMGGSRSLEAQHSLLRIFLWNELSARLSYSQKKLQKLCYFKSRAGSPVDFVWENIPIKLTTATSAKLNDKHFRALEAAQKVLKSSHAYLAAPVEKMSSHEKRKNIFVVPWMHWS